MSGQLYHSDIAVTHLPLTKDIHRNIRIYEGLIKDGHSLSAIETFHYGNELKLHQRYLEAINQYNLFLDSNLGTTDDCIEACLHVGNAIDVYMMINKHSKLFCNLSYMIDQSQKHVAEWANFYGAIKT